MTLDKSNTTNSESSESMIIMEVTPPLAVLKLNNGRFNVLTQELRQEIRKCLAMLERENHVRAVIITGHPNFCSGADINDFEKRSDPIVAQQHCRNGHSMTISLLTSRFPIIAAIEGHCLGGGLELALACDFRVVAENSTIGFPEIRRGVFPGTGGLAMASRLLGTAQAHKMAVFGDTYSASDERASGIIDYCVLPGRALEVASKKAQEISNQPAGSVERIKRLINHKTCRELGEYLAQEEKEYISCFQLNDAKVGFQSFFRKESPEWTHR
ncbi:hypothetical protein BTW10_02555 [Chromohalobacter japonicus]|uniref:Enoyl-CoA hydratase n=1 Tax=Chromohalobacter japonicus TaxID=223900 RepID=A0A1Q8TFE1_9GAMM|nr:enoyl-CoA hydratase/isomerase family protein [Chromohalobacter japonicus]OLO12376.1 hypothetical protein BTW10_02555 [Chromohalobacter japonicus]